MFFSGFLHLSLTPLLLPLFFFFCLSFKNFWKRFYLFIFRERVKEGEREGEKYQCVVVSCTSHHWGPGPQSRHVPWLGFVWVTLWFIVWHSIHWVTPARASFKNFNYIYKKLFSRTMDTLAELYAFNGSNKKCSMVKSFVYFIQFIQ